jgi:UDP-GlcNAc3NAcA epimerase
LTLKIVTVIGARPQFIKAAVVSQALRVAGHQEILVNTGQHYDDNMAQVFFDEMGIPKPHFNLGVGSGTHAAQTSAALVGLEEILIREKPDWVILFGDTNATIAGALAASKLHIKIAHIEAGLRSFNRRMPEEINRIVTDVLSEKKFVPTQVAVDNLHQEGITSGIHIVGDVMVDALMQYTPIGEAQSDVLARHQLTEKSFVLLTIHRPSNADDDIRFKHILEAVGSVEQTVVFPVHPRSKARVQRLLKDVNRSILTIDPVGYLDMMVLEKAAHTIITDSGGIQKEAYLHRTPCLTVRNETEWVETVRDGWNILVGETVEKIPELVSNFPTPTRWEAHYGQGDAAHTIVEILANQ